MHQKIERNDKSLTFYVRSISKLETLMRNPKNNEKHKKQNNEKRKWDMNGSLQLYILKNQSW